MPLYDFECKCGARFESVLAISDCEQDMPCPECGKPAKKIVALGHGGILRTGDSLPWIRDTAKVLTDDDNPNPNINTVQDLRQYYRDHPNIVPYDSHPALPSSLGDELDKRKTKADVAAFKKERSRRGHEKLRELRSITLTSRP